MIRTDGRPTIAWAPIPPPITDDRDPGDEHHEPLTPRQQRRKAQREAPLPELPDTWESEGGR